MEFERFRWWHRRTYAALFIIVSAAPVPVNAGSVTNKTVFAYYDVVGTTYTDLLLSVHTQAPRVNGDVALALLETSLDMTAVPDSKSDCKFRDVSFALEHRMVLPRLSEPKRVPDNVRKQFVAFQNALRKHEGEHRQIYLQCIRQMRRLILRLPASASCDSYEKDINDVIKFAKAECSAQNVALDQRDGRRTARLPLIRHALKEVASGNVSASVRIRLQTTAMSQHQRNIGQIEISRGRDRK